MPKRKVSIGQRRKGYTKQPKIHQEGNTANVDPVVPPVPSDVSSDAESEQSISVPARHNQHETEQVQNSGHAVERPASSYIPNDAWLNDPRISECLDHPISECVDHPIPDDDYDSDDSSVPQRTVWEVQNRQWMCDPNLNVGAGSSTGFVQDEPHAVSLAVNVQIEQIPNLVQQAINATSSDFPDEVIFVKPRIPRKRKNRNWGNRTRKTPRRTNDNPIPDEVPLVVDDVEVVPRVPQNNEEIPELRNFVYPPACRYIEQVISTVCADIDVHNCGEFNSICIHCNALFFHGELNSRGKYRHCCKEGTVCPSPLGQFPQLLLDLFLGNHPKSEHFLKHIRKYNSALSFVSIRAETVHVPGRPDTTFYTIQGKLIHRIANSMRPPGNVVPRYGQSYVFDAEEALRQRANIDVEHDLDLDLLRELDRELRNVNPFAQSYMLMRQVEEDVLARDGPDAIKNIRMFFTHSNPSVDVHQGRLNAPVATDVAMIYRSPTGIPPIGSFCIYPVGGGLRELSRLNRYCDPMTYALLYPSGGSGWCPNEYNYSLLQHYGYRFSVRDNDNNIILRSRKLFQEYVVDAYVAIEAHRLQYLRTIQTQLRRDSYLNLQDHIRNRANQAGLLAGIPVILPSSFIGSPRHMQQAFQDSMAVVVKRGKPDLFITFTCNPNWYDIQNNLLPGQRYVHRPELVARVFDIKLQAFLHEIFRDDILGRVIAYMGQIEFQKRGLPHLHLLLILHTDDKIRDADHIDRIVSAEIPNKHVSRELYDAVSTHMVHGPCGELNPRSPCMENGKCLKHFPRNFSEFTNANENGYPIYKRPDNGRYIYKGNVIVDNRFIVPYNWYLLLKYNAHINVEICNNFTAVKYLYKYIYKGSDMVSLEFRDNTGTLMWDEIRAFELSRYVGSVEAMWRILQKPLSYHSHNVIRLSVHLPNRQSVLFRPNEEEEALERAEMKDTHLTGFFKLNENDVHARQYLYTEIPEHYVWITEPHRNYWRKRQRRFGQTICRMYSISMWDRETYYLRMLLNHVRGPKSFDDVKTYNGVLHETFREACFARGLLQDDREWGNCLQEAISFQMPNKLRQLFAFICTFCSPVSPVQLWERFKHDLSEDFIRRLNNEDQAYQQALIDIGRRLNINRLSLELIGLPSVPQADLTIDDSNIYILSQENDQYQRAYNRLNPQQKNFFNHVMSEINGITSNGNCFHLDAFAGAGKSFVLNAILNKVRANGQRAIAVAWSGIAATLLKGGTTVHFRFKLPIQLTESSVCRIAPNSPEGLYIRDAKVIVWDECTMTHKFGFEAVDRALRDITGDNRPFGNKVIIMAGDWRQILPVVAYGNQLSTIEACIKQSPLWLHFRKYQLTINMRTNPWEIQFSNWLLKLGNGTLSNTYGLGANIIEIPTINIASDNLIQDVYGENINDVSEDNLINTAILSPRNDTVLDLNEEILTKFSGNVCTYYSADRFECEDNNEVDLYPMDLVHSLTPSGMPPHRLNLKVGAVIMLLRNLDILGGLCNGTRLIVRELLTNLIHAEIAIGANKGDRVFIPRMELSPTDGRLPFKLVRIQFPLRLSFAMTINKAQGQSLRTIGILLREPVFSHGMLYVAFSRATTQSSVHVAVQDSDKQGKLVARRDNVFTRNVVFREVLH